MDTVIVNSRRFGVLEVPLAALVDLPDGLPGVWGSRFVLVDGDGPFHWLQSADDPDVALPVTDPWSFFDDYRLVIGSADARDLGLEPGARDASVWVIVRADGPQGRWTANLRAPVILYGRRGRQVLNEAPLAPVRAPLFPPSADIAA